MAFVGLVPVGLLFMLFWIKVPPATPENVYFLEGKLASYQLNESTGDLNFRLEEDDHYYYINQDKVPTIDFDQLDKVFVMGETVEVIVFRTRWNPLNPGGRTRTVAALQARSGHVLAWEDVIVK